MALLPGTPNVINGIHPLAALMGQGTAVLQRGQQMTQQAMGRNTGIALQFLKDAASERIQQEQNRIEQKRFEANLAMQQAAMEQRERMHTEDLAARERMAGMRASGSSRGGGSSGSAGGAGSGPGGALMADILSRAFAGGQTQQPAEQAAPMAPPSTLGPPRQLPDRQEGPGPALAGPGPASVLPESATLKAENQVSAALKADLSKPENVDEVERAIEIQRQVALINTATASTPSGVAINADKASDAHYRLAKWKAERAKEGGGDVQGLALIDKAVADRLSPLDGFTGKRFTTEQDLELAMKDPDAAKAITLLHKGSSELHKDLLKAEPSLDEAAGLLDSYTAAAKSITEQVNESSFLAVEGSKAGSRVDSRNLVKARYDNSPAVQAIRGHQKVLQEVFNTIVDKTPLKDVPPKHLERILTTAEASDSYIKAARDAADTQLQLVREDINAYFQDRTRPTYDDSGKMKVDKDGKPIGPKIGNNWGLQDLNKAIEDSYGDSDFPSAGGQTLKELKKRMESAEAEYSQWKVKASASEAKVSKIRASLPQMAPGAPLSQEEVTPVQEDDYDSQPLPDRVNEAFKLFDQQRKR